MTLPTVDQVANEYDKLINEIDRLLIILRDKRKAALSVDKKNWTKKIDNALDERLRLMAGRDELKQILANHETGHKTI